MMPNETSYFVRPIEGQIGGADMLHKAYINKLYPGNYVYSAIQFMPLTPSVDDYIMKVINLLGAALFPISLCLLLPVFIYNIVLEKEQKLLEIMKMNGLRMTNYWIVNYVFNFIIYVMTCLIFILFGHFIL